jgi:hypothetical protein
MKIKLLLVLIAAVSVSVLNGCYPRGPEYYEDYDLVMTNYDPQYNFGAQKTYAIPDSIVKVTSESIENPDDVKYVSYLIADPLLDRIEKNMNERGYQKVSKDSADVILLPAAWEVTNVNVYYPWSYWGWYYPGYSPGWGWGYPYYPTYPVTSSYKTGSLMIQWTDPQNIEDLVNVDWICIFNGLLEGGTASIVPRASTAIDQAFNQSPYIKSN